jgi:hypothetical protein
VQEVLVMAIIISTGEMIERGSVYYQMAALTGAGDSSDSANIIAYMIELDEERLIFSNAYAALYVANPL